MPQLLPCKCVIAVCVSAETVCPSGLENEQLDISLLVYMPVSHPFLLLLAALLPLFVCLTAAVAAHAACFVACVPLSALLCVCASLFVCLFILSFAGGDVQLCVSCPGADVQGQGHSSGAGQLSNRAAVKSVSQSVD